MELILWNDPNVFFIYITNIINSIPIPICNIYIETVYGVMKLPNRTNENCEQLYKWMRLPFHKQIKSGYPRFFSN